MVFVAIQPSALLVHGNSELHPELGRLQLQSSLQISAEWLTETLGAASQSVCFLIGALVE